MGLHEVVAVADDFLFMKHSDPYLRLHHVFSVAFHGPQGPKVFCIGPP
jgi:hypothetical protein